MSFRPRRYPRMAARAPQRARAGRREISSLLGRSPKPRRCSLLSAHAALTASASACRRQSRSSTSGRKNYSSNPPAPRFIFLPQNESSGLYSHSVACFWPKTLGLRTQNGQMGIPVHSVAIRQTDSLSPFILWTLPDSFLCLRMKKVAGFSILRQVFP